MVLAGKWNLEGVQIQCCDQICVVAGSCCCHWCLTDIVVGAAYAGAEILSRLRACLMTADELALGEAEGHWEHLVLGAPEAGPEADQVALQAGDDEGFDARHCCQACPWAELAGIA